VKFLIIHNRYSRAGGEENVVRMQTDILTRHGHQVQLYERSYDETLTWRMGRAKSFFTSLRNRQAVREIDKLTDGFKPDVAIVHNLYPVISPAILPVLHRKGIRVLMTVHNYRLACPTGLFFTHGGGCERCGLSSLREMNCALRKCEGSVLGSIAYAFRSYWARAKKYYTGNVDRYLALSEFQRNKLIAYDLPSEKFRIVPNCLDTSSMPESDTPQEDYIGYVGRLSPEKGIGLLFETARKLPHLKFKVAGEAADRIDITNVPPNIELTGQLAKEQLADFYTAAKFMIVTSVWYEPFGLTVLEAMYYRQAVIVPDIGAPAEIIGQGGLVYKAADADSLAQAITLLDGNALMREDMGLRGRARVEAVYNPERYYEIIMESASSVR